MDLFPAAIVRGVTQTRAQLVETGRTLAASIRHGERMTLEKVVELGGIVNHLQSICEHGDLLKAYDEMNLQQQRASEYARIAKLPAPVLCLCHCIADAIEATQTHAEEKVVATKKVSVASTKAPAKAQKDVAHEVKPEVESPQDNEPTLASRLTQASARLHKLVAIALKTREATGPAKQAAKELAERMEKAAAYFAGLPVRKPFKKKCECGMEITVAVTEKDKWLPLHEGRGEYEIIDGVAVRVEGFAGAYRNHYMACSKSKKQETF